MPVIIPSYETEDVIAKDSLCILFGKCQGIAGVITGIFEIDHFDLCVKGNPDGSFIVSPTCYLENKDYEFELVEISVPMYGLVMVPKYTGPVIREIKV
jgi:hypothetical protein